jgi:WD40 repeat protein
MVKFSPDGRTLASCGWDNTVRLWDVDRWDEGSEVEPVTLNHPGVQFTVAFAPDGSLLASAGESSLTIWSLPGCQRKVERVDRSYRCLAFSPDSRTLALGAEDGTIRLWDVPGARERAVLQSHADTVKSLAFSPDGKLLASSSQEGRVVLWDANRGVLARTLVAGGGTTPIRFVTFSPDGRTVAMSEVAFEPRDLILFDVETGAIRKRLTGHRFGANTLAFSPDGRTLATAGVDRCIKLWDLATGKERITVRDHVGWVKSLAFSPDGARLAFSGEDTKVRLWNLEPQRAHPAGPLSSHPKGT